MQFVAQRRRAVARAKCFGHDVPPGTVMAEGLWEFASGPQHCHRSLWSTTCWLQDRRCRSSRSHGRCSGGGNVVTRTILGSCCSGEASLADTRLVDTRLAHTLHVSGVPRSIRRCCHGRWGLAGSAAAGGTYWTLPGDLPRLALPCESNTMNKMIGQQSLQ